MSLIRKKQQPESEPPPASTGATAVDPAHPQGKGRPTPKRRDAQAANRRPLVADTKNLSADQKARQREERSRQREAMLSGDEKYLPERDRGPERRFLRDAVDRRLTMGEVLLPAMLLVLALSLLPDPRVKVAGMIVAYAMMLGAVVDCWLLWRRTKARFVEVFRHDPPRGAASYVILRAMQMRASRAPRPAVKRGDELRRR